MTDIETAFSSLFNTNMGYRAGEQILVFSDLVRADETVTENDLDRRTRLHSTAKEIATYAQKQFGNGTFVDFSATAASGTEPPVDVWQALFGTKAIKQLENRGILTPLLAKTISTTELAIAAEIITSASANMADIVIAMSNNSTSHTNFRKLACQAGVRFASLPHFDPEMFFSSMNVDWHALAKRTANLVTALNRGQWIRVTCPNGTDMQICKQGRIAEGDDGLLIADGAFGNLPAGEAYLAPLEGKSHGKMVVEWGPTAKLDQPLTLIVEKGEVVSIAGDDPLRQRLEAKFSENAACRNLAELGIGTNDKASRPDNVLEAEKIMGTIHLALGDNTGFGGCTAAPFHEDYVFYQPTVTLQLIDGTTEVIIEDGQFKI